MGGSNVMGVGLRKGFLVPVGPSDELQPHQEWLAKGTAIQLRQRACGCVRDCPADGMVWRNLCVARCVVQRLPRHRVYCLASNAFISLISAC